MFGVTVARPSPIARTLSFRSRAKARAIHIATAAKTPLALPASEDTITAPLARIVNRSG
jgi:hypothetical protein